MKINHDKSYQLTQQTSGSFHDASDLMLQSVSKVEDDNEETATEIQDTDRSNFPFLNIRNSVRGKTNKPIETRMQTKPNSLHH